MLNSSRIQTIIKIYLMLIKCLVHYSAFENKFYRGFHYFQRVYLEQPEDMLTVTINNNQK